MKQTNNAIKFLLAQYRAIYKHAYAKGVLSGLVLSAGLIAGSANAGEPEPQPEPQKTVWEQYGFKESKEAAEKVEAAGNKTNVTINETAEFSEDAGFANSLNISGKNTVVTVKATSTTGAAFNIKDTINISNNAKLVIQGSGAASNSGIAHMLGSWTDVASAKAVLTAKDATIELYDHGNLAVGSSTMTNTKLTIGKDKSDITNWGDYSNFWTRSGDNSFINSTITMKEQSVIGVGNGKTLLLDNTSLTMNGGNVSNNNPSVVIWGTNLKLKNKAHINVAKGKTGSLAIKNIVLDDASTAINVETGASLFMHGTLIHNDGSPYEHQGWTNNARSGTIALQNGTIKNDGTITIGKTNTNTIKKEPQQIVTELAKTTFTQTGGTFDNNGQLNIGEATEVTSFNNDKNIGTTYTLTSGVFDNAKTTGKITINTGSSFVLDGGIFNNSGSIVTNGGEFVVNVDKYDNGFDIATLGAIPTDTGKTVIEGVDAGKSRAATSGSLVFGLSANASTSGDYSVDVDDIATLNKLADTITLKNVDITIEKSSETINDDSFGKIKVAATDKGRVLLNSATYQNTSSNNFSLSGDAQLVVNSLTFAKATDQTGDLTLKSGDIVITSSLNSADKSKLVINETAANNVDLTFETADASSSGSINIDLDLTSGDVSVLNGSWSAQNVKVGGTAANFVVGDDKLTATSITGKTLDLSNGKFNVNKGASASFNTVTASGATATINGTFNVLGDGSGDTVDFVGGNNFTVDGGSLNLSKVSDTIGATVTSGSLSVGTEYNRITVKNGGTLVVDLAGITESLTLENANKILGTLATGNGLVSLKNANVDLGIKDNTISFDNLASSGDQAIISFDTEETRQATVTGMTSNDKLSGGWKNVVASGNTSSINATANQTLKFYGTTDKGAILSNESGDVVGIKLESGSVLNLDTSGQIGAITGDTGVLSFTGETVSVVNKDGSAKDNVSVETIKLADQSQLSANKVTAKTVDLSQAKVVADTVEVAADGLFKVDNSTLNAKTFDLTKATNATVAGGSLVGDSGSELKVGANLQLSHNAVVKVDKISINGTNGTIEVGTEGEDSSSAHIVAKDITLKGGSLIIDPEFNQETATVFAQNIGTVKNSILNVDGSIIVGRNSALGIGGTEEDFVKNLAKYQENGSLSSDGYGAMLYVGRNGINLDNAKLVIGTEDIDELKAKLNGRSTSTMYLGSGSAISVSEGALYEAMKTDANEIFVATKAQTITSNTANPGTVIVPIISSTDAAKAVNALFDNNFAFDNETSSKIVVRTENGLWSGEITSSDMLKTGEGFDMKLAENAREILSDISDPLYDYHLEYSAAKHQFANEKEYEAAVAAGTLSYDDLAIIKDGLGYRYLNTILGSNNAIAAERTARLATFAGAVQATNLAARSTTDAISGRFGMASSESMLTMANNQQGAALWVTPIYKSQDSDSFGAQGISYGADVDLFGAALGFDYTLNGGIRIGGMFNVGSGDAEGQGAGAGAKSDFDYYGFGIYAGFSPIKNLSITTDISYTVVDNDLSTDSGHAEWGKFTASTDTSAVSVGVTGQYTFNTASLDVAPHIGLRFTRLDMDNYEVKNAHGAIAFTDADAMNIFSIPVGVSIAKDIVAGSWTIRPAVDFTVTINTGDDSIKNVTEFDGIIGTEAHFDTEVMDTFTYGADLGISGTNGSFAFGINAGYVGSSETSEYSVSANARLMF